MSKKNPINVDVILLEMQQVQEGVIQEINGELDGPDLSEFELEDLVQEYEEAS